MLFFVVLVFAALVYGNWNWGDEDEMVWFAGKIHQWAEFCPFSVHLLVQRKSDFTNSKKFRICWNCKINFSRNLQDVVSIFRNSSKFVEICRNFSKIVKLTWNLMKFIKNQANLAQSFIKVDRICRNLVKFVVFISIPIPGPRLRIPDKTD